MKVQLLALVTVALLFLTACAAVKKGSSSDGLTAEKTNEWTPSSNSPVKKLVFSLPDMDKKMCETFPRLIVETLEGIPGVIDASFQYDGHVVTVYYDPSTVSKEELLNNDAYAWVGTSFLSEEDVEEDAASLFAKRGSNNPEGMPQGHMADSPEPGKGYTDLSAEEFKKLLEEEDVFLLDVHVPEQRHIPGTDALIPFDKISLNLDKLPKDKNAKIAVYCRSGRMSAIASEELARLGYTKVYNLVGGVNEWKLKGYALE